MAALCISRSLFTFQSGGSLLTYTLGSDQPLVAVNIQKPEREITEKKVQPHQHTGTEQGKDQLLAFGVSPRGRYLVGCDDYKQLWVWTRDSEKQEQWTLLSKRILPRRSSSLTFTSDEKSVLVGDKSGDAYSYQLEGAESEGDGGSLLAGHISMLLDVLLCGRDDNFLVTCDRDEKIRVSHFPNAYNIQAYCLGHTEFVSKLGYFEKEDFLLSGGGDGTLRIWNYMSGTELFILDLKPQFTSPDQSPANQSPTTGEVMDTSPEQLSVNMNADQDEDKVKDTPLARTEGVADVKSLACCQKNKFVALSCDRQNVILLYKLVVSEDGSPELIKKQKLSLTGTDVWCVVFDEQCHLWYLQSDKQHTTGVFAYSQEKDQYEPFDSCNGDEMQAINNIVSDLNTNQQDFFKAAFTQPVSATPLHKVKIDNITEYHERKQQKMAEKLQKRKGSKGGHHDSTAEQLHKKTKT